MASLSRDAWLDAAYDVFNRSGLPAVRVEPLAKSIGATKGSFYWHFVNRAALIDAIMDRWEQLETDNIIVLAEQVATPLERLETVYTLVGERMMLRGGERTLYSEAESEGVSAVVARVTGRRIDYVASILNDLGFRDAQERAAVAVSAAIGLQQLVAGGWHSLGHRGITDALLRMSLAS